MTNPFPSKYRGVTISGKIATGTTTLAKNLQHILDWEYVNAGAVQRQYDREHDIDENRQGASARPDEHEKAIEAMAKKILTHKNHFIYEAWLAGFVARNISGVLKVLLYCSVDAIRIDRVANRDCMTINEAKKYIKKREEENIAKWKKLYGDHDFWGQKHYDLVIDTFSSGPLETTGKVLDKLGYRSKLYK